MDYNYNTPIQQDPYGQQSQPTPPTVQLTTNRGLLKFILFTILTLGIYSIVVLCKISNEINTTATKYDGKNTMHFIVCLLLSTICGFFGLWWYHTLCARMGDELKRRGINYSFGAGSYWGWGVLGSFIIIGPFVFIHKMLTAQNLINADYNLKG